MIAARKKPPVDHEARTRAATDLVTSIALSAGAGSGKTSVLTARIVGLLESGVVAPGALAAMTFTEKAAGEILARVRDALEARLRDAATPAQRRTLEDVLARFGDLTLTTIHAFCRQLLLHETLEADFAPGTDVGDEAQARALLDTAIAAWLETLRAERPQHWRLIERLVSQNALALACQALDRYRDLEDVIRDAPFDATIAVAELDGLVRELADAAGACSDEEDGLFLKVQPVLQAAQQATARRDAEAVCDLLLDGEPLKLGRAGIAGKWGGAKGKERAIEAALAIDSWKVRWRAHAHADVVRSLRAGLLPAFDELRQRAGVASFDDLLRLAARLLRTRPEARERLAQRFQVLLVDEVQDTDPVQAEVATLLSRALHDAGPWHESQALPGKLFVVGDPKQSIYRFRGADVGTFARLAGVVARNGAHEALEQNFRSVPGIVSWVNHTFATLAGFSPQVAHRDAIELDPVVLLQATDEVGEIEAAVRHLRALLDERAMLVDRDSGARRPIEPRDVMFLLPAWSRADAIADRLRQSGIDSVVEGGDTFFSRDEVRLGMAALRALVEPADTEAVVFLLRGVFGHSHEELARHKAAGGSFRFTIPNPPPSRVADSLAILQKLHRGRGARGLAGLLDELWAESRALAVWRLLPDGASRLANLDKLAAMVREAEQQTLSPLGALEEMQRVERTVRDKDISRLDADAQAVRVTTLFKAKGLEAPVVFVLHAARTLRMPRSIVDHQAGRVAVKIGKLEPEGWPGLEDQERVHANEERRRWMYVAATRARDQLVICRARIELHAPKKGEADGARKISSADLLRFDIDPRGLPSPDDIEHDTVLEVGPDAPVRMLVADDLPEAPPGGFTFPGKDADIDALLATPPTTGDPDGDARERDLRARLRESTRACVRWRQASGEPGTTGWKPGTNVDEAPTEDRVGPRGGRVIHAVMERLDLSQPHDVCAARAAELVQLLSVPAALPDDMREKCARIVERILKNPLVEEARQSPLRWHEVPFTFSPRPGTVISGTIDLVFARDAAQKEWVVFDWKSHVPPEGDKLRDRYRDQLLKYAQALVRTMEGARVVKTEIVGPYPELGEMNSADGVLVDVSGLLRGRLEALLARGAPMPIVGGDLEGTNVVPELAWPEHKLLVVLDATDDDVTGLQAAGWTVTRALDDEVARVLGVADAAEDA